MPRKLLAAIVGIVAIGITLAQPAAADPGIYAQWTMGGAGGAYTGTMTVPTPNFPAATWTSDARADSAVESGASTWLGDFTPFGAVYGTSQNQPYVRLRPAADNPLAPSTTTYTFDTPTPASGWGFALGDIDADEVEISATDADGNPVPVDGLGFESAFNYCQGSPRPSSCSGITVFDQPTWVPGTNSGTLVGNPAALDTTGAAGWFQPTVPLSTLTFVFRQRSGFPVYQTWFSSLPQPPPTTTTTTTTTMPPSTTTTTTPPMPTVPPIHPAPGAPPPALSKPAPPAAGQRTLPATGSPAMRYALLGAGLLVVGTVGVGAANLRRRMSTS